MITTSALMRRMSALCLVGVTVCLSVSASQSERGGVSRRKTSAINREIAAQLITDRQFTHSTMQERGGADSILDVKSIDLNRDGKPEYVVSCNCENMSSNYVYRRTANGLKLIYDGTQRENLTVLKSYSNEWRDIRSTVYRSIDGAESSAILRLDGSRYK